MIVSGVFTEVMTPVAALVCTCVHYVTGLFVTKNKKIPQSVISPDSALLCSAAGTVCTDTQRRTHAWIHAGARTTHVQDTNDAAKCKRVTQHFSLLHFTI